MARGFTRNTVNPKIGIIVLKKFALIVRTLIKYNMGEICPFIVNKSNYYYT